MKHRGIPGTAVAVSFCLFICCLFLPGFVTRDTPESHAWEAIYLLGIGWLGPLALHFEWYANPLLLTSWILALVGKRKTVFAASTAALVLALSFLLRDRMIVSEAPTYSEIISRSSGYWMWLASIAVMVGVSYMLCADSRHER
jgi:hypothetical protein